MALRLQAFTHEQNVYTLGLELWMSSKKYQNQIVLFQICVVSVCDEATADSLRMYNGIDFGRAIRADLNAVCILMIQHAYLWLWVIWFCEVLAACLHMAVLADEHSLSVISIDACTTQSQDSMWQQKPAFPAGFFVYLDFWLSVILGSLHCVFESSIRSSVPYKS